MFRKLLHDCRHIYECVEQYTIRVMGHSQGSLPEHWKLTCTLRKCRKFTLDLLSTLSYRSRQTDPLHTDSVITLLKFRETRLQKINQHRHKKCRHPIWRKTLSFLFQSGNVNQQKPPQQSRNRL